jgi:hypothetical protein
MDWLVTPEIPIPRLAGIFLLFHLFNGYKILVDFK